MRVLMYPARSSQDGNPYIDVLAGSLRRKGVEVIDWDNHCCLSNCEIFHIHWPEHIAITRRRRFHKLRADLMSLNFFRTIERVKRRGGKIAWTVHNLSPHEHNMTGDPFLSTFMRKFTESVDVCISLTHAGIPLIRVAFPPLSQANIHVVRHPHYRHVLKKAPGTSQLRASLGIRPNKLVFSMLGTLRASKDPLALAREFSKLSNKNIHLLLAGSISSDLGNLLLNLLRNCENHTLISKRLTQDELINLYSVTDTIVMPADEYLNSGTIYTALSLDVPVLASSTAINREIQTIAGAGWVNLFSNKFSAEQLVEAEETLRQRPSAATCDLSALDPDRCAEACLAAYESALKAPRGSAID